MFRINIFIITLFILQFIFINCSDYLDKQPDDMLTEEMVWTSKRQVEGYLVSIYAGIPENDFHRNDPWIGLSDEADITYATFPTYGINLGNWSPALRFYDKYPTFYKAIRSSIVFERNVDRCYELSEELRNRMKAEAKFLRGYYYYLLIRLYGPVVIIDDLYNTNDDWNSFARTPFDECVDYICNLMDEAEKDLPESWKATDRSNLGRPDRIVCRAVKSQTLLLAASPQWNGNTEYSNFKNKDGTPLTNTIYDENKWKRVAEASKSVIDISEQSQGSGLKLYKNSENPEEFNAYKSVLFAHIMSWNSEIIFGRTNNSIRSSYMIYCSPGPNNLGGVGPTQRVVDAFYMNNGLGIEDSNSGYIETGFATEDHPNWNTKGLNEVEKRIDIIKEMRNGDIWGHRKGEWNMYANREARFYASILYNKRVIPQLPEDLVKRNYYNIGKQQDGYGRVELYYGGTSRSSGSYTFYPRTGYLVFKGVDPRANMRDREYPFTYTDIFIRYATILLNYIEALNEYDPNHADIEKYWNQIRERAGIPGIFEVYPEIKGNKAQQRDFILRERQIELCFEGDRYLTARRRWLAHTPDEGGENDNRIFGEGGRMWGMDINAGNATTNDFNFLGFYKRVPFETRVFNKSFYLFPIHESEITNNTSMVQNPWW